jgi:hypothetical protein
MCENQPGHAQAIRPYYRVSNFQVVKLNSCISSKFLVIFNSFAIKLHLYAQVKVIGLELMESKNATAG